MDGVPDAPWVSRSVSPLGHARAFITTMVTNLCQYEIILACGLDSRLNNTK